MKTNKVLLLFLLFFLGCGNSNVKKQSNEVVPENFKEFYKKFYIDSTFQMSRIVFPLKGEHSLGLRSPEDSLSSEWKKEEWKIKTSMFRGDESTVNIKGEIYIREFKTKDTVVTERIYIKDSGFEIIKKYSLRNDKWFLVYYYMLNN